MKSCENCKWLDLPGRDEPCRSCGWKYEGWAPADLDYRLDRLERRIEALEKVNGLPGRPDTAEGLLRELVDLTSEHGWSGTGKLHGIIERARRVLGER